MYHYGIYWKLIVYKEYVITPKFNSCISSWGKSKVISIWFIFCDIHKKINNDVLLWDIANITSMGIIFNNTQEHNTDILWCDISSVSYISSIFNNVQEFDSYESLWSVSKIKSVARCLIMYKSLIVLIHHDIYVYIMYKNRWCNYAYIVIIVTNILNEAW